MNASIRFNLNDPDDRMRHMRCIKSLDMALALFDIQEKAIVYDSINISELHEIFQKYNITMDEIIC